MWSNGRFEAALEAALPVAIEVRPMKRAKRFRLRFDEAAGVLKLTCPWRTSRKRALAWAVEQRDWIQAQIARAEPPQPFVPGMAFPLEGEDVRLVWNESAPRAAELVAGELRCGGPLAGLPRRTERFLRERALETMSSEVRDYAAIVGVQAAKVSVGDASGRWGSCSATGRIRLSWRLILAPREVRRFVVAHEVAHLVHMDHGPEFKALERRLFGPGVPAARAMLAEWGPRIRRVGRG
ncbi:MAG TPA: SprT family zinc-dependent metalloprotease [Sphingomicrobium sp.]|nr:SprT family zinc-dependent metalloprotease [Sphingomicrobium sp.]